MRVRELFFYFLIQLCFLNIGAEPLNFKIHGDSVILMNAQTGKILFEHEAYTPRFPASTTKIATALYALKIGSDKFDLPIAAELDSIVTLTQEAKKKSNYENSGYWLEPDGTHIGLKKGEFLTLRQLLEGLLIASGNDAANVIAQELGPTIPVFLENLNAYLKEIGCKQTTFYNPHGLHHPEHQTTAYDLALMTREALKDPVFREIVSKTRFNRPKTNKQEATTYLQGNRLLRPGKFHYSKAIGVKTGYHSKAKKTLVAAAQVEDRILIAVLLGYADRNDIYEDAKKLFEGAFNQPKLQRTYLKEGNQSFKLDLPKSAQSVHTYLESPLTLEYYPAEDPQPKCLLYWHAVSLPIKKDQAVGELHLVSLEGEILKKGTLLASDNVHYAWPYRWFVSLASQRWLFYVGVFLVLFGFFLLYRKVYRH